MAPSRLDSSRRPTARQAGRSGGPPRRSLGAEIRHRGRKGGQWRPLVGEGPSTRWSRSRRIEKPASSALRAVSRGADRWRGGATRRRVFRQAARIRISGRAGAGAVRQRARFGTVRPRVRIPGPRPLFEYVLTGVSASRRVGERGDYSQNYSQSLRANYSQRAFRSLLVEFKVPQSAAFAVQRALRRTVRPDEFERAAR